MWPKMSAPAAAPSISVAADSRPACASGRLESVSPTLMYTGRP